MTNIQTIFNKKQTNVKKLLSTLVKLHKISIKYGYFKQIVKLKKCFFPSFLGDAAAKVVFYILYLCAFCGSVGAAQFLRLKIYNNRTRM